MRKRLVTGFIGLLLIIGVVIVLGIWPELPYFGWEKYQNKSLPSSVVINIGENIKDLGDIYPGFTEAGKIIIASQKDPKSLEIYPKPLQPFKIEFDDFIKRDHALAGFSWNRLGRDVGVNLKNKKTGEIQRIYLVDPETVSPRIGLDNSVYLASSMAKKILLVKEFSHILYVNQFKEILAQEVTKNYEIDTSANAPISELLMTNAIMRGNPKYPSPFGYYFDNSNKLVDYAGYWHIMPSFGMAIERGLLDNKDTMPLDTGKKAFDKVIEKGLLIKTGGKNGSFVWKVGPFSKEWIEIMSSIF